VANWSLAAGNTWYLYYILAIFPGMLVFAIGWLILKALGIPFSRKIED
jgi:hypothetical protein